MSPEAPEEIFTVLIFATKPCVKKYRLSCWNFQQLLLTLSAHAHESYCSQFVCVCLSVCPHASASLGRVCNKFNLPARSSLNFKGFELTDFAKKLYFLSYSSFFTFARPKRPFQSLKLPRSLVPRCHPLARKRVWWIWAESLGLCWGISMHQSDCRIAYIPFNLHL